MGKRDFLFALLWALFGIAGDAMLSGLERRFPDYADWFFLAEIIVWIIAAVAIILVLFHPLRSDRKRLVWSILPTLDTDAQAWLRRMLSGARPIGISDFTWQTLEQTGLVERDFSGPKGIIPVFEPHIRKWFGWKEGGQRKMIAGLLMAAGIILFITGLVLYNEPFDVKEAPASPTAENEPPKKPLRFGKGQDVGLKDLLMFEFPNAGYVSSERFEVGKLANARVADFITMYPNKIRAEFYVILIPDNANAYAVSEYVARNYKKLREDQGPAEPKFDRKLPKGAEKLGIPEEVMKTYIGEKLPFTGQIYIYHEGKLSDARIQQLKDLFAENGVVVEFRGPEHIRKLWAERGPLKE